MTPQPIYGAAEYLTGEPADGAYVEVTSSLGTISTYVGPAGGWNSGYWQVDVGYPGPDWPDGTSFTIVITDSEWESDPLTDTVDPNGNNVGTITLQPPSLNASTSANPTTVPTGDNIDFTGSATGGVEPYTWNWDFGDGNTSTSQNPTHAYESSGTFTATLTVNDSASQTAIDTVEITVLENTLSVTASANPTTVQTGTSVEFNGTAAGGTEPYTWEWDFGDGSTSTQEDPSHAYSSSGIFTATLTVIDDLGFTDSDTVSIDVNGQLSISTDGPYESKVNENITLNATASGGSSPYDYSWDLGNGDSTTGKDVSYAYSNPGIYTITLTVEDNNGLTSSIETSATIYSDGLMVTLDAPETGTENKPIQFAGSASNGVEPYTWNWDFGDGQTSTEQNPTHTYENPGNYTVTLNVTDDLDVSNVTSTIIHIQMENTIPVTIDAPATGFKNYPVSFSGTVQDGDPPYTWYWEFGDGQTSTEQNPSHTYTNPGQYTVYLSATDSQGRSGNANVNITINQNYHPAKPTVSGTFRGEEDRRYTYTLSANDPEGQDVYFYVDWGDDENTDWIGPYRSGEQIQVYHIWDDDGSYNMRVKAKDPYDAESDWTENVVRMPYLFENPILQFFQNLANRFPLFEPLFTLLIELLG